MARALVIYLGDLARGPRVRRQIALLREQFEVIGAGFAPAEFADVDFIDLRQLRDGDQVGTLWTSARFIARHRMLIATDRVAIARGDVDRAYFSRDFTKRWAAGLAGLNPDLVLVSGDALMLPVGFVAAAGAPVVFDAQEHAPSENASNWRWRLHEQPLMRAIWKTYLPRTAELIAVGAGSAEVYEGETGARASVVTNAVPFVDLAPSPVDPNEIRMVHWGIAGPQRHLEDTIALMRFLDHRYRLDLVFVNSGPYVDHLKSLAAGDPRIRFLPPVPIDDLAQFGNAYDIGVVYFRNSDIQHEYALPNKFFESVQARLAVASGPSPDLVAISHKWGFGIVGEDYSPAGVARAIARVTPEELAALKSNASRAANSLTAECNDDVLREIFDRATSRG